MKRETANKANGKSETANKANVKVLKYGILSAGITAMLLALYRLFVDQTIDILYVYTYYVIYLDWLVLFYVILFAFCLGAALAIFFKRYSYIVAPVIILVILIYAYSSKPAPPYTPWHNPSEGALDTTIKSMDTGALIPVDSLAAE